MPLSIIHTLPSLALSEGGPPRSVSQLCCALSRIAAQPDVSILSEDTLGRPIVPIAPSIHSFTPQAQQTFAQALEQFRNKKNVDIIHQNGIWRPSMHQTSVFARKAKIPLVLTPRGMLEPWALKNRYWKKKAALLLYQRRDLKKATAFHATALSEAQSIRALGLKQPIIIAPNGIVMPSSQNIATHAEDKRERIALFLSRVNPKKGLPNLLKAWAKISPKGWRLRIAGNDDSNLLPALRQQAEALGIAKCVDFVGPLFGAAQRLAYRDADLFVLPSFSENFGIVIAEALSHGVPVLTTTGTPWEQLHSENCGWWVAPTEEAITQALEDATNKSVEERVQMGKRGIALVERDYLWPSIAQRVYDSYQWLLGNGPKPSCVLES